MPFSPIAIVGQGCVLPGALSADEYWELLRQGRTAIRPADRGAWRLDHNRIVARPGQDLVNRAVTDHGGYVSGFESKFDPAGFQLSDQEVQSLDSGARWLLESSRQSLTNCSRTGLSADRQAVIIGNLGYPSGMQSRICESIWMGSNGFATRDFAGMGRAFHGNLAELVGHCLGFRGNSYTIDAACASSLYAIHLACQALHDDRADLVLAGGANNSDDLFLHIGFSTLKALSPTGFSRPFSEQADGLIPAHGAALVALKRLEDAVQSGDTILGVIRGIGVSNDGKAGGFLSPAQRGQAQAIRMALAQAELTPSDIQVVECHATGTTVGDGVELAALNEIFGTAGPIRIGSHKGNIGHAITAAGAAGLLKVLGMFRHQSLVPTIPATNLRKEAKSTTLQVCDRVEAWSGDRLRRAGLSAFGFGGANAHLIVEEWIPTVTASRAATPASRPPRESAAEEIVIVGACALTGASDSWDEFVRILGQPASGHDRAITEFRVPVRDLGFPPRDLKLSMPQQVAVLSAVQHAAAGISLPTDRTAVFIGTDVEPEISRYGLRWRFPELAAEDPERMLQITDPFLRGLDSVLVSILEPAGVTGTMPNIPAHRINVKHDLQASGFTVSAGELSGIRALQIAIRGLRHNEFDAAVVGAVDLCSEAIHEFGARSQGSDSAALPGDAAVVFLIKRRRDAEATGDPILASIQLREEAASGRDGADYSRASREFVTQRFGNCGAAAGLLQLAVECATVNVMPARGASANRQIAFHSGTTTPVQVELSPGGPSAPRTARPEETQPGQQLTFPAHPPRLVFPPLIDQRLPAVQVEIPAPQPTPVPIPIPVQASRPAAVPAPAAPTNPTPSEYPLRELAPMAGKSVVTSLHEQYLQELTRSHQLFLAARSQAMRGLQAQSQGMALPAPINTRTIQAAPNRQPAPPQRLVTANRVVINHAAPPTPAPATPVPVVPAPTAASAVPLPAPAVVAVAPPKGPQAPVDAASGEVSTRRTPTGPSFNRQQLEVLAGGRISDVFGPLFEQQDGYRRQVRMPMPPLLLADRVTGIDAEPGRAATGTIWTETDVTWDSWYLHQGTMPAGIMIESGQADLLLISWMGADFLNRDQRVYRLLGCEATYFGGLPRPGETLCYQITIDGHARQGDIRLFFFHYDCYINGELRLRVRHGQAGFFSTEELNDSDGILWTPDVRELNEPHLDPATIVCEYSHFGPAQLADFYAGNMTRCFGRGFERMETHSRTPKIGGPELNFIDEISAFEPAGGPWKRGYLRAVRTIRPDDWYFKGHFLNDPCMPGTLMLEACLQAMSFYLTGLGYTVAHDGWQFEPVGDSSVSMQCRGQVTPVSQLLTIELFIEEVRSGPDPTLFADLLCTVDGVKAFYARRMGLKLVPSWPITSAPPVAVSAADATAVSRSGVRGDYAAFLECAWGRPSIAFGPDYIPYDTYRRTPRLPSPPYHFISRATRIDAEPGDVRPGAEVVVEYDVPREVWYFDQSPHPTMPLAVLMEALLQPCGWLAMMSGVVLRARQELFFRNLDGKCTVLADVTPESGTLRTTVKLVKASTVGETTIMFFEMTCFAGTQPIARSETSFGFFTRAALSQQVGVTTRDDEKARLKSFSASPSPAPAETDVAVTVPMLQMSDRVLEYTTDAGRHGKGHICAEQDVTASAWYFKAHFYQDPVQPGSLGVQALVNLLHDWVRRTCGSQFVHPQIEPVAIDEEMVWTYRGQVVPTARRVHQCVDIIELKRDDNGVTAIAEGTLWADGLCIYRIPRFAVRLKEAAAPAAPGKLSLERTLDPATEPWWKDHCPTHAVPTMPLMGIANELAQAARTIWPAGHVVGIRRLNLENWLTCATPTELKFEGRVVAGSPASGSCEIEVRLRAKAADSSGPEKSVAVGTVLLANKYADAAAATPSLTGLIELENQYANANLFHGPAFQLARRICSGAGRSVAEIGIDPCSMPAGTIHPGLLDAALHGVPHADWSRWHPDVKPGLVGFPVQLERLDLFGPPPTCGAVTAEARLLDVHAGGTLFSIGVRIVVDGRVWADFTLREKLFPMGAFYGTPLVALRQFMGTRQLSPEVSLSKREGAITRLSAADVSGVNWLPGTLEQVYGISGSPTELAWQIAVREHVAGEWSVHPSAIDWDAASSSVALRSDPRRRQRLNVERDGSGVVVRSV